MAKKKSYTFRSLMNDLHLWLGLASGIILFLVCLSGTVLTFEHEIKAAGAEPVTVTPEGEPRAVASLIELLETADYGTVTGVALPAEPTEPWSFTVKQDPGERRGRTVLVDPYTGAIHEAGESAYAGLFRSMFFLHRWLLLDTEVGRPIVGVATVIFLFLALSGLVLWFPRRLRWKNLRQGLRVKTDGSRKRLNHDLHNTLGFYACGLLIVMCLTGLCWSFEGYREGLSRVIGAKVFDRGGPELPTLTGETAVGPAGAIALAQAAFPYPGELNVSFPGAADEPYRIRKYDAASWSPVVYDQLYLSASGTELARVNYADKSLGERIAGAIKPLHTGEIFGWWSKVLYFLACLIATSLPVTGTLIWWGKLRRR
ncbi:PepSY-associated TM helix domain-containing protein [Lewinella sp. IMCC34183]|uniref:PepSY-associated TM helix domain-containing protein n=1 Tax=Lewinella sp. IMCC34183 TaxID=2248762 RepID=UPI000E248585|nr:PepSY-associated TM helix domain-containing protein [Lewinella sp. IMCC34183]